MNDFLRYTLKGVFFWRLVQYSFIINLLMLCCVDNSMVFMIIFILDIPSTTEELSNIKNWTGHLLLLLLSSALKISKSSSSIFRF